MRKRPPSSRGFLKVRFSIADLVWAVASPLLALYFRDAYILTADGAATTAIYCLVALAFSLAAFAVFGISNGVSECFSVHDALDIAKAVGLAGLMTCVVLFSLTRLEGIPRSVPVIQALVLAAALVTSRAFARFSDTKRQSGRRTHIDSEHIIMIGSNRVTSLCMQLIEAYSLGNCRVIAVLDDRPKLHGRKIGGVRILGLPQHLESIIHEFEVHGVRTHRVIIGSETDVLSDEVVNEMRRVCERHKINLEFVPQLLGMSTLQSTRTPGASVTALEQPSFSPPPYFRLKRFIDFAAALVLIVLLSPLFILAAVLALLDLGSPVLFWQQRMGTGGRTFQLYKIRTLRAPFDSDGRLVAEEERLSWIGRLLRRTCLDELPQLFNVLVGDMSLIGPRPLLPIDQPADPAVRLMVPPGITGWAQVQGGKLITPGQKEELDEWYIRNASLWLDLRIIVMTVQFLFGGEDRAARAFVQRTRHSIERPVLAALPIGVTRDPFNLGESRVSNPRRQVGHPS